MKTNKQIMSKKDIQRILKTEDSTQIYREYMNKTNDIMLVDLGLTSGTLWADRNIGADAPEQTGDYYRFGEIVAFTEDSPGYVYDKIKRDIAGTDMDAATMSLGTNYRMPTFNQIKELFDECKWKWTKQNGAEGMKVTGPNDNSIFFPASGYRGDYNGSLNDVGLYGCYWSASALNDYIGHAFDFHSGEWRSSCYGRAYGYPIRAVSGEFATKN